MGFFTDTTVCIGCKACEVACKQWNDLPADGVQFGKGGSYDHTGAASARRRGATCASSRSRASRTPGRGVDADGTRRPRPRAMAPASGARRRASTSPPRSPRWTTGSSCPTSASTARTPAAWTPARPGALIRTEFETVVLQADVCNGCGYCIPACPFGVVDARPRRRPRRQVHALLRPPAGRPGAGVREGLPDRLDPVRALRRARRPRAPARRRAARARRARTPTSTAPATSPTRSSPAASARSSCSPSRPSATACRLRPTRRSRRTSCRPRAAAYGAALLAAAGAAAAFLSRRAARPAGAPVPWHAAGRSAAGSDEPGRRRRGHHPRARHPRRARPTGRAPVPGATVALQSTGWRDARWSFLFKDDTRYAPPPAGPGGRRAGQPRGCAAARCRARARAVVNAPGLDVGDPAVLLARRDGDGLVVRRPCLRSRRRPPLRRRSRAGSRSPSWRPSPRAADRRPRAARRAS